MLDVKKLLTKLLKGITYTYVGTATGSNTVALPSNWKEINVIGAFGWNDQYGFSNYFQRKQIQNYSKPFRFISGSYISANDYHCQIIELSETTVNLQLWNWSGNDVLSTSKIYVWAR